MARDPMRTLQAVRIRAVAEAQHAHRTCLLAEVAVTDRIHMIDVAMQQDRAVQQTVPDAHRFQEMFVLRRHAHEMEHRAAEVDLTAAEARSAAARAVVVAARTAAEAVKTLIADRAAADQADVTRREQHELDDMARTRSDRGSHPAHVWTR